MSTKMRASIQQKLSSYVRRRGKDGTLFKSCLLAFGRKNERAPCTAIAANYSQAPHISLLKNVRRHTYSHLTFWVVLLHISNFACPPVTASGANGGGDGGRREQSRVGRRIRIDPEVSYHLLPKILSLSQLSHPQRSLSQPSLSTTLSRSRSPLILTPRFFSTCKSS